MRYCCIPTIIWIPTALKTRIRASPAAKMFQCLTMSGKTYWRGLVSCKVGLRSVSRLYFELSCMQTVDRSPGAAHTSQFITNGGNNRIQSNPVVGRLSKRIGGITMESRPFRQKKYITFVGKRKQLVIDMVLILLQSFSGTM